MENKVSLDEVKAEIIQDRKVLLEKSRANITEAFQVITKQAKAEGNELKLQDIYKEMMEQSKAHSEVFGVDYKKAMWNLSKPLEDWNESGKVLNLFAAKQTNQSSISVDNNYVKRLIENIVDYDASLDDNYEVGIQIMSAGSKIVFNIVNIFCKDSLVCFYGINIEDGMMVRIVKHISQADVLLIKLLRKNLDEPKQPYGFNRM